MTVHSRRDARFWLLALALLAVIAALIMPPMPLRQDVYDIVAVIDITGSMNTRDMGSGAHPVSRLAAVRERLTELAAALPCQSRLGLAVFTERRAFLLFDPVAVCDNYGAITGAVAQIDWRMAWEGDSYIAKGLYSAIELGASLDANVLFLTDGQEAPPLPAAGVPPFDGKPGDVPGLIVGVGGKAKSPIPKFDDDGREIGVYGPQDVPHDNRHGLAPASASAVEGWHPRNAPFGASAAVGDEHLSSVREEYLRELSARTGFGYVTLESASSLVPVIQNTMRKRNVTAMSDVSAYAAATALALLGTLYGVLPLLPLLRRSRSNPQRITAEV